MTLTEADVRMAIGGVIDHVDAAKIELSADFYDLGLDSLHHAQIILRVEELYGLRIPDEDFEACRSIDAILEYAKG